MQLRQFLSLTTLAVSALLSYSAVAHQPTVNYPLVTSIGIDVSHFQQNVDWEEVKKAEITFVYSKATQGINDVDPKYKRNRTETHANGLHHGPYHFYVPSHDPIQQADFFIKTVQFMEKDMMPPVLDLEMIPKIEVKQYQRDVLAWLKKVEADLGVKPIIYTYHPFGNQYLNNPEFANYHLWIAEYGVSAPKIPTAWKNKGWLMWQRSERGKIEGVIGNVDHDLLKGKPEEIY